MLIADSHIVVQGDGATWCAIYFNSNWQRVFVLCWFCILDVEKRLFFMFCAISNAVRNRMKSVKNIQKITKAMKMVAASKLRPVQIRTENS
jgi:hypothetical protein